MKVFCAFDKERECNEKCVAYVDTGASGEYHFTFPCARIDSVYDQAAAMTHIMEELRKGLTLSVYTVE